MRLSFLILILVICYAKYECTKGLCPPEETCLNCNYNNTKYAWCFNLTVEFKSITNTSCCTCNSYNNCWLIKC